MSPLSTKANPPGEKRRWGCSRLGVHGHGWNITLPVGSPRRKVGLCPGQVGVNGTWDKRLRSMPTLSIITAVLAGKHQHLAETYRSLAAQELPAGWDWEWLVQEDGETGIPLAELP